MVGSSSEYSMEALTLHKTHIAYRKKKKRTDICNIYVEAPSLCEF